MFLGNGVISYEAFIIIFILYIKYQ